MNWKAERQKHERGANFIASSVATVRCQKVSATRASETKDVKGILSLPPTIKEKESNSKESATP